MQITNSNQLIYRALPETVAAITEKSYRHFWHQNQGNPKDLAALAFKAPTSDVAKQLAADSSKSSMVKPNMATMAGAVPLMAGGKVIGAIGVSGASSQQDEKCAVAGAEKIKGRLE